MINQTVNPGNELPKNVRVPLSQMPDAKEGDTYTVSKLDSASGMAILSPESTEPDQDKSMSDDKPDMSSDDDMDDEDVPEGKPNMDTKTLLGPMDGLKNYLVQKSMDAPKNSGR